MLNKDFKEFIELLNANQVRYLTSGIDLHFSSGPEREMPTIYLLLILRNG